MKVHERFLNYVSYDTQSDSSVPQSQIPSTAKQKLLGKVLAEELSALGIADAAMDELGYVYGHLPASDGCEAKPALALLAHMDTAMDMSGANIKPRIIHNYDGADVRLSGPEVSEDHAIYTTVQTYPSLKQYLGQDLIVTDGTTLLGADNKAGIAEIVTLISFLQENPAYPHPPISICFTPDEEIGRSADHIDLKRLNAVYGYTVDGGPLGEMQYENFNAASAEITIHGIPSHIGYAKGILKSAAMIAIELQNLIPACTSGREGFYHLDSLHACTEKATAVYLIRDHNAENFRMRKDFLRSAVHFLNKKYGDDTVELVLSDTYLNMINQVLPHPELISLSGEAMRALHVEPICDPIRGGTDGCRLSYMGLPCPNLCTGGQIGPSRHEFITIQSMEMVVELLKHLVKLFAERT